MSTSFANTVMMYVTPAALVISILMNFFMLSGRYHKFRNSFHKLEHIKLQLEIEKLKLDLGGREQADSLTVLESINEQYHSPETAGSRTIFKLWYRLVQGFKYVVWLFMSLVGGLILMLPSMSEDSEKDILVPFLSLILVIGFLYALSVYVAEWLRFNQIRIKTDQR
ncbi:MAG: hypothetical protein JXR18_11430 [Neptuniibacter sp.]